MSLEDQVLRLADDLRPPKWIAKKLKINPAQVIEMIRNRERELKQETRSRNRVEKMVSDARRSTLPVKLVDSHTRDWGPKDPPKGGGRGQHFLPSGLVDRDFKCVALAAG